LQRFAKFADQSAPNRLVNMMFLKGSFYFSSRSNVSGGCLVFLIGNEAKPYTVGAGSLLKYLWTLQKFA
jgi:hypothetical protein